MILFVHTNNIVYDTRYKGSGLLVFQYNNPTKIDNVYIYMDNLPELWKEFREITL